MVNIVASTGEDGLFSRQMKRVLYASVIGSVIEWYDFVIYGTAAALVFNHLFFPAVDPAIGVILSLGTYAVGYFRGRSAACFLGILATSSVVRPC